MIATIKQTLNPVGVLLTDGIRIMFLTNREVVQKKVFLQYVP